VSSSAHPALLPQLTNSWTDKTRSSQIVHSPTSLTCEFSQYGGSFSKDDATTFYENKNAQPRSMTCLCNHLPANASLADSDILNDISSAIDTSDYILMSRRTESSTPISNDSSPRSLPNLQTQFSEQALAKASTSPSRPSPSSDDSTLLALSELEIHYSDLTSEALAKVSVSPSPLESYVSNEEDLERIVLGLSTRRAQRLALDPMMLQILESI
jgi:hypothetical protein